MIDTDKLERERPAVALALTTGLAVLLVAITEVAQAGNQIADYLARMRAMDLATMSWTALAAIAFAWTWVIVHDALEKHDREKYLMDYYG